MASFPRAALAGLLATLFAACTIPHAVPRSETGVDIVNPDRSQPDGADVPVEVGPDVPMDVVDVPDAQDAPDIQDVPVDVPCPAGETRCGSVCVNTQTAAANCGACGNDCAALPGTNPAAAMCTAGVCDLTSACLPGRGNCDGTASNGCEAMLTTAANCGACGTTCTAPTPNCGMAPGATTYSCLSDCSGMTPDLCGTACTNLLSDPANCMTCGNACPTPTNGAPTCTAGACGFTCNAGFGNCDGMAANGCEVNTQTSPANCGTCGNACTAPANATATCAMGMCGFTCTAGFANCDGMATNGCEVNTQTSPANCGMCGMACAAPTGATATCATGMCGFTCNAGLDNCDGDVSNGCEANTQTSTAHCGMCNNACGASTNATGVCNTGTCGITCNAGFGNCDGSDLTGCEVDTRTSVANCGMCGMACAAPANGRATCAASTCGVQCNPGYTAMGAMCSDAAAEACPGIALALPIGRTRILGTTTGRTADVAGSCGGTSSEELIYAVTPAASGTLVVRATTSGFTGVIYARTTCASGASEIGCDAAPRNGAEAELDLTVTAGTTYFIVMDGGSGGDGPFMLLLDLQPACGNRAFNGGEQCDDGNITAGDGCNATCQREFTPGLTCPVDDDIIELTPGVQFTTATTPGTAGMQRGSCVPAGATSGEAVFRVRPAASGRLRVSMNPVGFDGAVYARASCPSGTELACANDGGANAVETIDLDVVAGQVYTLVADGAAATGGTFGLTMTLATCGNGTLEGGTEECDDGNTMSGDGCSATCAIEPSCVLAETGPAPFNAPRVVPASCTRAVITGNINPAGESDFYRLSLRRGQIVEIESFTGAGTCGANTVLEFFASPLASNPTNGSCTTTTALECKDDNGASQCAVLFHEIAADGDYLVRLFESNNNDTITNYGLRITVR